MRDLGGPARQWMAESLMMNVPGHEARGGSLIRWEPTARRLESVWQTQDNLVSAVCTVSGATRLLYCWGARNREWTLEGYDWHTGHHAFTYVLGKSRRFDPLGGPIIVAANGAIDCGCSGAMGVVRIQPRASGKTVGQRKATQ